MTQLEWIDSDSFSIGDCRFTIDVTPGPKRRLSTENNFTLVKTKRFLSLYDEIEEDLAGKKILELGIFEGGSLVFFDKRFRPSKLVGLDIREEPIPALDAYTAGRGDAVKVYYGTSQADQGALDKICQDDFDGQVDVVIDDASHLYDLTKASFEILFKWLAPGGTYIIEDWAWSYQVPTQERKHPWYKKTGMATLLFELIGDLAANNAIDFISIDRTMAIITKSKAPNSQLTFGKDRLRGRSSPEV
ncbi:class I SAM-dependent methyltransferase [Methyloligella sp. 2.7D]|uniref:class I SAM-dependent methyltransferase n=1 Tax=unclassified Methyloligella TaxID=2625955 RepID=UPI00157CAB96|nr:class I SAM-dependent methyltransferase [Methyloligella sp. GL2]QKP77689.1 class I SAM-dependent methyltransferase [Methyloligella sp. GL2]